MLLGRADWGLYNNRPAVSYSLMKDNRRYFACQHAASTTPTSDNHIATLTRPPSAPASLSTSSDMGLQPLMHATGRLPHLVTCGPSGADQNCHCTVKPQERTILHGILTGQGHKFGYGGKSCMSSLFTDSNGLDLEHHNGLCLDIGSLDDHQMVRSQEVTSPSRYITPPRDK